MVLTARHPEKILRETAPTASFTLTVSLIAWISQESARRGVPKSVVVREILESARAEVETQEAIPA
jgi:hypothetical protein